MSTTNTQLVGLREWIALPDFGLWRVRAKIDTGARTSALHASNIVEFSHNNERWVRFEAGFSQTPSQAKVIACKRIKSSTGHIQERYVISTELILGAERGPVQFTLTCRKTMRCAVLLGTRALVDRRSLVDPGQRYLHPKPFALR